jgi:nitroreductase
MRRRAVLRGAGAALVLVAGGAAWRAWDQGLLATDRGPAYEPWTRWQSEAADGALGLLRAAILAANPHNSQPWLFRVTPERIDLFADTRRNLGAIDPYLREMYIGIGCALENLTLAARAGGYAPAVTLLPDRASTAHAARIELSPGPKDVSALYRAIPERHTNRGPYDGARAIGADITAALDAVAGDDARVVLLTTRAERERAGTVIVRATEAVIANAAQGDATSRWERFHWRQVQHHRDGITIDATVRPAAMRAAAKLLPPLSRAQNDRFWLRATQAQLASAAAIGIVTVVDPDAARDRVRGGRAWQRVHLWATAHGLAAQPHNQPTERADRERMLKIAPTFGRALADLIGDDRGRALMTFRLGYPTEPALPSPRRPLTDVLL